MTCPTVYLAGSINCHRDWKFVAGWRAHAAEVLGAAGYRVLNPLRGRKPTDTNTAAIVERDFRDISQSDIVLVEMDYADKAYIGTAMEIRYAWERGKEITLWGRVNRESHWLKYHATWWFDTLDQALNHLNKSRRRQKGE